MKYERRGRVSRPSDVEPRPSDVAFYAAVLRGVRGFQARDSELQKAIEKRRLGLLHQVEGSGAMDLEISFEGLLGSLQRTGERAAKTRLKYCFHVSRVASSGFVFTISGQQIAAQARPIRRQIPISSHHVLNILKHVLHVLS